MKAFVAQHERALGFGAATAPEPAAGPGRVVVAVRAVSLNRGELLHLQRYRLIREGAVPGWDVAGVVVEPASDGSGPPVGARVFGWSDGRGTWAERVAVRCDHLSVMPPGLSFADASTLGVAALTAFAAIGHAPRPLPGASVIVTGATGGVGAFAVQLALLGGARTTAVARAATDLHGLADILPAGATVEQELSPDGDPADLVIDSVGGNTLSAALQRVATGGTVVTLGRTTEAAASLPPGWFSKHAQVHGLTFAKDYGAALTFSSALGQLGHLVADGALRTNVTRVVGHDELETLAAGVLERRIHGKAVALWGDQN